MITKKFNKTFDEALIQAYLFQSELVADQLLFTAFSPKFTPDFTTDFLSDIEAADDIPTNENDLNSQTRLSQQVEDKMELCRAHYQKLLLHVEFAWPNSDTTLKDFGNSDYMDARKIPSKLIDLMQDAYREANSTEYKAPLIAAGFIQTDITLLDTLADDLKNKYKEQQTFIRHSSTRAQERAVAFNKVWDTMVQISAASKLIFKDNPAKIEYYLLYPEGPGPGALTAPTGLSFTISNMKISWNTVTNATSYIAQLSTDGGITFEEVFTGVDNFFIYQPSVEGTVVIRVFSNNANGHGPMSTLTFTYYSILPTLENVAISLVSGSSSMFELRFSPVLSAASYKIYKSEVTLGDPAGEYTYVTDVTGTVYSGNAVSGKRSWFVVKASNAAQQSGFSEAVYLDVNGTV